MAKGYHITWNEAEFNRILQVQTVPQAVWKATRKVRDRAKANITAAGRVDTGAMRNSLVARRVRSGKQEVRYQVGSDLSYTIYQHDGTQGPIVPRRARVLRFTGSSGQLVFAKQVRGVRGVPFLTDALKSLSVADFE